MKIKNINYTVIGSSPCMSCECDGARYHVWISRDGKPQDTLYKNSQASFGEPGYHATRKLSATSVFGKKLIASMQEIVEAQNLVKHALERVEHERAEQKAKTEFEYKLSLQRDAGPALYKSLDKVWDLVIAGKIELPEPLLSETVASLLLAEKGVAELDEAA